MGQTSNGFSADTFDGSTFDYVVIGAGSAGCVVANRLTEDTSVRVCLIEAGPKDTSPLVHIPLFGMMLLYAHERMNWRFWSTPQPSANGRRLYLPRGKVLGGTSAINGMVYMRGHPADYDAWAAAGNRGWSFAEVVPYFLRSENNQVFRDSPFHGTSGLLDVTDVGSRNPIADSFVEAAQSLQLPFTEDFNGSNPAGVGYRQVTQRAGRRLTSAGAFLDPARSRKNLAIMTGYNVDRLMFQDKKAVAVKASAGGRSVRISVAREVILSAGAFGSPHILLSSGVGEASQLSDGGVDLVHHLPGVGRNLHDHPAISAVSKSKSTIPHGLSLRAAPRLAWSLVEYALFKRGLLASNVLEAGGYVKSNPQADRPDLQFSLMSGLRRTKARGSSPSIQFGYGHGYGLTAIGLHPYSRGDVRIAPSGQSPQLLINPNVLSDERDLETLLWGLKYVRRILAAPALAHYRSVELMPGDGVQSDDDLRDYIRGNCGFGFHPVGTCAMGHGAEAVVDDTLRLRGMDGLRVIDASIMPSIPGGNTHAPTVMIAEKGCDLIRGKQPLAPIHLNFSS